MRPDMTMEIRAEGYKPFRAMFFLTGSRRNERGIPVAVGKISIQEYAQSGALKGKIMGFVDIFCDGVIEGKNKKDDKNPEPIQEERK